MVNNNLAYFYDGQIKRVITQMIRIFSGFRYLSGADANNVKSYATVPVMWGDGDRQAQHMLTGNSENVTLSVPRIAVSIIGLTPAALTRGSYAGNVDNLQVQERQFDQLTGQYTSKIGNSYQVDRLQPNPIDIKFAVDIWTSNTDQKLQLFEQIFLLFNPMLDLQTVDSPLDWTAIQSVMLDDINWSVNGLDRGTDDTSDILSMTFTVASYISAPARVKKQKLINTIITNIGDALNECDNSATFENGSSIQSVVTIGDHWIQVTNNSTVTLLGSHKNLLDENGNAYSWQQLIDDYGEFTENYSTMNLRWVGDIENSSQDIIGFINLDPTYNNILNLSITKDTLPIATLSPILKFINPLEIFPGNGLPIAKNGDRYIVLEGINPNTIAWGNFSCNSNDIIQFNGTSWIVSYDSIGSNILDFVTDSSTGNLYKLVNHAWVDVINGFYSPGFFRLNI